ncbi:MAG TPA: class I SAM-dependent methyltransferase [Tepidisphaeraceae bacterium]|nr:class I SAM-dependent methyltransferase [Tepidisphaeraceae bacterium]
MTNQKDAPTPERLMQMAWGYAMPLAIEAAIANHVFDHLDAGPKTIEQLSRDTGASARGLRMLMNMLVSIELLSRDSQQRYSLTQESSSFLVSTKPSFQGGIFKHLSKQLVPKWERLSQIVKDGKPVMAVNAQQEGAAFFEQFVEDIFPMSYGAASVLGDALNLREASKPVKVLDIAAGSGVWGIALAQKSSQVKVTALDWENVLAVTRRMAAKFKVQNQFNYIAGDLNTADFGNGYDIATLGHILHSEGETNSRQLVKRVYDALAPGGTIIISEFLVNDDHTGPANAAIFAVNMLVNTEQGDTFSFNEIARWLREAGFKDARTIEAPAPSPLILATK